MNLLIIFTDGFRSCSENGDFLVVCSVVIPSLNKILIFKLNFLSSSYTAESIVILEALELTIKESWKAINICIDSLSVITKIKEWRPLCLPTL